MVSEGLKNISVTETPPIEEKYARELVELFNDAHKNKPHMFDVKPNYVLLCIDKYEIKDVPPDNYCYLKIATCSDKMLADEYNAYCFIKCSISQTENFVRLSNIRFYLGDKNSVLDAIDIHK